MRDVEVADGHGVGIAEGDEADACRGPRSNASDGSKASVGSLQGQADRFFQAVGHHGQPAQDVGSPPLDAKPMKDLVRRVRDPLG